MEEEVIGLTRKSPDDRESSEISLSNQEKFFTFVCNQKSWNLIKVFEDFNISGSVRDRKGLIDSVEFAKKNNIKIILVKDSSRFIRDSSFFKDFLIDLYAETDIRFYSCTKGGFLDPNNLADKMTAIFDEEIIIRGRVNAEILINQKREDGLPPIKAPFGYSNDKKTKSFKIIPKQAEIVCGVIQDYLNSLPYGAILLKYHITRGIYDRIIKNACNGLYSGFIYYQKKRKDSRGKIAKIEEVSYSSSHEKILSDEIYSKLKELKCQT